MQHEDAGAFDTQIEGAYVVSWRVKKIMWGYTLCLQQPFGLPP